MEIIVFIILCLAVYGIYDSIKQSADNSRFDSASNSAFMGSMEVRLRKTTIGESDNGIRAFYVEVRGLMPLKNRAHIGFMTSLFDMSGGRPEPVISLMEECQEPGNIIYQHFVDAGEAVPGEGYPEWARIGVIIPEMLKPPYGGQRILRAIVRVVDFNNPPEVDLGFLQARERSCFASFEKSFTYKYEDKGYLEAEADRLRAWQVSVGMAVAVAMADGSFANEEGQTIKSWIKRHLETGIGNVDEIKDRLNQTFKKSYNLAVENQLSLSGLTEQMNEVAEKSEKYEAIELCLDVMVADGRADKEELRTIRGMADALGIDYDELRSMQDKRIVNLNVENNSGSSEDLLGIDLNMTKDEIRKHLNTEYKKWNARINMLEAGEERENAQRMLDAIADARRKYL